jgi:hypothetical protein
MLARARPTALIQRKLSVRRDRGESERREPLDAFELRQKRRWLDALRDEANADRAK